MSALNMALKQAVGLGGTIREFDQGQLNFCTGFAARWIKYRLLGKGDQFWSNPGRPGKGPVWAGGTASEPYRLTTSGQEKFRKAHQEADQQEKHGFKKAGIATNTYLLNRFNKPTKLAGVAPLVGGGDTFFIPPPEPDNVLGLGKDIQCLAPNRAMHISLQPRKIDRFASFHSTAALNDAGKDCLYFDPNMGEVRLPIGAFPGWWSIYVNAWKSEKTYALFEKYVGSVFNGEADLVREVRARRQALAGMTAAASSGAAAAAATTTTTTSPSLDASNDSNFDKIMAEMAALSKELEALI